MEASSIKEQCKNYILLMSNPKEIISCNEWLVAFEKQIIAWDVANELLFEDSSTPFRFFGAKILYSKIQRQYHQLNPDHVAILTKQIVDHLIRLSSEKNIDIMVCRYLSLCISALSVHLNQDGIVRQILEWLNPILMTCPRIVLLLLIVIPEECFNTNIDVTEESRNRFSVQLSNSSQDVINFLTFLWPSSNADIQIQILNCFENWIRYCHISDQIILNCQLLEYAFSSLLGNDIFIDKSVDLFIALIQSYDSYSDIALKLLYYIVELRNKWNSKQQALGDCLDEDDINVCRAIARLFSEVSETYILIIVSSDSRLDSIRNGILEQLLACARFSHDISVSRIPLKFFYELSALIKTEKDKLIHSTNSNEQESLKILIDKFSSVYITLLDIAVTQMTLPIEVVRGVKSISDEFDDKRYEWRDTILDCYDVLGENSTLKILFEMLENYWYKQLWNSIESVLLSIMIIAPSIAKNESLYIPQILSLFPKFPADTIELSITAISLLGKLSKWISANDSYVNQIISLLITSVETEKISIVSSKSIMQLLESCSGKISIPIEDLLNLLHRIRRQNIPHDSILFITEGLCMSISFLPQEKFTAIFHNIVNIVISDIQSNLPDANIRPAATKQILFHIDELIVIFRSVKINSSLHCNNSIQIFPFLYQILDCFNTNDVCEKVCKFYKYSIRNSGKEFLQYLPQLSNHLIIQFQKKRYSAFLYVAGICVSDYGQQSIEINQILYDMTWSFSTTFFEIFPKELPKYQDVVEDYFFFLEKLIRACPTNFILASDKAVSIILAGINVLQLRSRDAQKGVLLFYEGLLNIALTETAEMIRIHLERIVLETGEQIVNGIFQQLVGAWPLFSISDKEGSICNILWTLRDLTPTKFNVRINI